MGGSLTKHGKKCNFGKKWLGLRTDMEKIPMLEKTCTVKVNVQKTLLPQFFC